MYAAIIFSTPKMPGAAIKPFNGKQWLVPIPMYFGIPPKPNVGKTLSES